MATTVSLYIFLLERILILFDYSLFDWPHTLSCRLVILCIANSLDLTDRLLPRLKARSWRPVLLHFKPYSHEQLTQIAYSRLSAKEDAVDSPIDSRAVQLCARKVSVRDDEVFYALFLKKTEQRDDP